MKKIRITDSLGDIVAAFPSAGDYFINKHIDFCCGGNRSLEAALKEMNLDSSTLLSELNQRYEKFQEDEVIFEDWAKSSPEALINHIIKAHHQFLREELHTISALLFKLLGVHGKHHVELFEVHHIFNLLRMDLESHLVKEENWLFPELLAYSKRQTAEGLKALKELVETIETEHVGAGELLKSLREITDHYSVPSDGCTTYALTYSKLQALEKNTFEHIHLENNILLKNL